MNICLLTYEFLVLYLGGGDPLAIIVLIWVPGLSESGLGVLEALVNGFHIFGHSEVLLDASELELCSSGWHILELLIFLIPLWNPFMIDSTLSGFLVSLGILNISVETEIWDKVILRMSIFVWVKILSASGGVADWVILDINLILGLNDVPGTVNTFLMFQVLQRGNNLMIHSVIWYWVINWMFLGLFSVEKWGPFSVFGLLLLSVLESGENISIDSEISDGIILWIFIFWWLLMWGSSLGVASDGSAGWGRLLMNLILSLEVMVLCWLLSQVSFSGILGSTFLASERIASWDRLGKISLTRVLGGTLLASKGVASWDGGGSGVSLGNPLLSRIGSGVSLAAERVASWDGSGSGVDSGVSLGNPLFARVSGGIGLASKAVASWDRGGSGVSSHVSLSNVLLAGVGGGISLALSAGAGWDGSSSGIALSDPLFTGISSAVGLAAEGVAGWDRSGISRSVSLGKISLASVLSSALLASERVASWDGIGSLLDHSLESTVDVIGRFVGFLMMLLVVLLLFFMMLLVVVGGLSRNHNTLLLLLLLLSLNKCINSNSLCLRHVGESSDGHWDFFEHICLMKV